MPRAILFLFLAFISYTVKGDASLRRTEMTRPQEQADDLDKYYSTKRLGAFAENGSTVFRLFAPRAERVVTCLFDQPHHTAGKEFPMTRDEQGVWEASLKGEKYGKFYGFKVFHQGDNPDAEKVIVLDPYARAVASYTDYFGARRGILMKENDYDWEGVKPVKRDWRDLIIYEAHVRDMTAHPTSGAKSPGTYRGLHEKGITGGLPYIKSLGVNTVELLPAMEFQNIELPYRDTLAGRVNTWNPYERNHWGYMTAAFFAPEAYYAEEWKTFQRKTWEGASGKQVNAFKDMVKAFHKEGIAVIMDVVYNHLSEYEAGNLKEIDKQYYFRLDAKGNFIAESGCGNDLKTERPMLRRLIVESILFWMKEYHIDGFRFDLGKLLDWATIEEIIREARKVNPSVVFVCEPWGGGYDPAGFSRRGWGAWNDQIRNGIKGENPNNGLGWIFGKWYGNNSHARIRSYVNGTLTRDSLGLFVKKEHSVNYLESHDGYTLGDFIRIGTQEVNPKKKIHDVDSVARLTPHQMRLNKLAAAFLLTAQGMTMLHAGQEYARTKVIPLNTPEPDEHKGLIDHNTYDKDNEVNYLNYAHAAMNAELLEYYKGLIALRKNYAAFRRAEYEEISFFPYDKENPFALAYTIRHGGKEFICLFNARQTKAHTFALPAGKWEVLVNDKKAGIKPLGAVRKSVELPPVSALVLIRKL